MTTTTMQDDDENRKTNIGLQSFALLSFSKTRKPMLTKLYK